MWRWTYGVVRVRVQWLLRGPSTETLLTGDSPKPRNCLGSKLILTMSPWLATSLVGVGGLKSLTLNHGTTKS